MELPFAEDLNYWKTGQSSPEIWIGKAVKEIESAGGKLQGHAFGTDASGRGAYMIQFMVGEERYKVVWPVLPCKKSNEANDRAARIQATTMLYYDVKTRCVAAKVLGVRSAFFNFLMLADGRTAAEVATPELGNLLPDMFGGSRQLTG